MGRTQPRGIAGHHGTASVPIFGARPAYVSPAEPAGPKRHSQPREGPRMVRKALPGRFTPDCGESAISADTSLRVASRIRGLGCSVSTRGEPVAVADLIRGGLGRSLTRCSVLLAFTH